MEEALILAHSSRAFQPILVGEAMQRLFTCVVEAGSWGFLCFQIMKQRARPEPECVTPSKSQP